MFPIKSLLTNKLSINVISLIMAYCVWSFMAENQTVQKNISVPVCLYNCQDLSDIDFPEKIMITLEGKRAALASLDYKQLAVHLDGELLTNGPNGITLSEKNLFLPTTIKLVNYKPTNLIAKKSSNTLNKS